MKIHEAEARELLGRIGLPVPDGATATTPAAARAAALPVFDPDAPPVQLEDAEAERDDAEQCDDQRLDPTEAEVLQPEDEEHVERGDQHADLERNSEQKVEADRGADDLGEVGRADRDLGHDPQRIRDRPRKRIATRLRQIAARAIPLSPGEEAAMQYRHPMHQS